MVILSGQDPLKPVSQVDNEALLTAISSNVSNPVAGIFGPASLSWRINRESALFLGAGRAALLQLAHPWVTASLLEHSTVMNRPIERFHNTFRIVFTMIFGSLGQAQTASRHLYAVHSRIQGEMTEDVARWMRGSRYTANEIGALRWVFATLVESAVVAYECALPPLTATQRENYYAECKTLAGLFGLPASSLPTDWNAFAAYNREMHSSTELGVSVAALKMAHDLLRGAGSWVRPPIWYRALTTEWLPERLRAEFELEFGLADQRAAVRARRLLPGIYRRLPQALRFIGPWREAQARIAHRPVDPLSRWSNRFWIGRPLLPFQ